jgi:hypothetical protein
VREKYVHEKFKIVLVSLDFPKQLETALKPYIIQHQIQSEVILLDDPDQNRWINKTDSSWSGDIPFTIIYGRGTRESYARSFKFNELDSIINFKLNAP